MPIAIGDRLPDGEFKILGENGPEALTAAELFDGRKIVLFGVPGAFTPTCHRNHLPGFLEHLETIKQAGVDEVAVIAVNDVWVMGHWAKATGGGGRIRYLSDGNGDYVRALGLDADLSMAGMGTRSVRFSMIANDRVVRALNIEDTPGQAITSGAARILEQL